MGTLGGSSIPQVLMYMMARVSNACHFIDNDMPNKYNKYSTSKLAEIKLNKDQQAKHMDKP